MSCGCGRLGELSVVGGRRCRVAAGFGFLWWGRGGLPVSLCWLPGLRGRLYRLRFIATSSACAAAGLSVLLTSCLVAIKSHVIECCAAVYEINGNNLLWSVMGSVGVLGGLKSRGFLKSGLSACGLSALCAALSRGLVGDRLTGLVERAFNSEGSICLACGGGCAFFCFSAH